MSPLLFGTPSGSSGSDGYRISYEEILDYSKDFKQLSAHLMSDLRSSSRMTRAGVTSGQHMELYQSVIQQLSTLSSENYTRIYSTHCDPAVKRLNKAAEIALAIADALQYVHDAVEANEEAIKRLDNDASGPGGGLGCGSSKKSEGHAPGFYAAAAEAEKERLKKEKEEAEATAAHEAWMTAFLAYLAQYYPETYAEYMKRLHEEEDAAWLEELKEKDPILYELVMEEKKRQEEARKAAEEAQAALEAELAEAGSALEDSGLDSGLGDLSSDLGSGLGGGGGGFGGGGSDLSAGLGGVDDWASDLLSDAIDTDELYDSAEALDGIAGAATDAATGVGVDAVNGATDLALDEGQSGFFAQYGPQIASFAHAYGLQAAAAIGGAVALYVTREQTTEAVAHVAEFVSTKCKPFATDVMDQVKGAAKKTSVNISNAKSRAVGVTRGEREADLLG